MITLLTLYLSTGLLIALTEHRGCRGFVVTGRKRALANIAFVTLAWGIFVLFLIAATIGACLLRPIADEEAGL